jgi:hypothetical protein
VILVGGMQDDEPYLGFVNLQVRFRIFKNLAVRIRMYLWL